MSTNRLTTTTRPIISTTRPCLKEEQLQVLARRMRDAYHWSEDPRFFQVDGSQWQIEGTDGIIQAPTGQGKTGVVAGPYAVRELLGGLDITIMVVPLLALQKEMVTTFEKEFGLTAVAINSTHGIFTQGLVDDLLNGRYNIVLASPEMLQSRNFVDLVLRRPEFTCRVLSMVVDEAHCVSHWGSDFRKAYGTLGTVRAFLPRNTPVVAVTATLTARVRRDLHSKLDFKQYTSRFHNAGNDRPNVSIVVRAMEHPQNTYKDLDFIIPDVINTAADIPKTYIYADDIRVGTEIVDYLNGLIAKRSPALASEDLARPYNATMSDDYRAKAMEEFRAGTKIRILVCTDAAGMGCNVSDIDIVIQWKLPKSLSQWVQRAGRVARHRNRRGIAILLVERSAYSINIEDLPLTETTGSQKKKSKGRNKTKKAASGSRQRKAGGPDRPKAPKGYAVAHGLQRGGSKKQDVLPPNPHEPPLDVEAADEGLLVFVQTTTCRREVWRKVFESFENEPLRVECCDICQPALLDRTRPPRKLAAGAKPKKVVKGSPDRAAQLKLDDWRQTIFDRDHSNAHFDAEAILSDELIEHIASLSKEYVDALDGLERHLKSTWVWWDRYGEALLTFIKQLQIRFTALEKKGGGRGDRQAAEPSDGHPASPAAQAADVAQLSAAVVPNDSTVSTSRKRPATTPSNAESSSRRRSKQARVEAMTSPAPVDAPQEHTPATPNARLIPPQGQAGAYPYSAMTPMRLPPPSAPHPAQWNAYPATPTYYSPYHYPAYTSTGAPYGNGYPGPAYQAGPSLSTGCMAHQPVYPAAYATHAPTHLGGQHAFQAMAAWNTHVTAAHARWPPQDNQAAGPSGSEGGTSGGSDLRES